MTPQSTAAEDVERDIRDAQDRLERELRIFRQNTSGTMTSDARGPVQEDIAALVGGLAKPSMTDIDNVMSDLEHTRRQLQTEGERIRREVALYLQLCQKTSAAIHAVSDALAHLPGRQGTTSATPATTGAPQGRTGSAQGTAGATQGAAGATQGTAGATQGAGKP